MISSKEKAKQIHRKDYNELLIFSQRPSENLPKHKKDGNEAQTVNRSILLYFFLSMYRKKSKNSQDRFMTIAPIYVDGNFERNICVVWAWG